VSLNCKNLVTHNTTQCGSDAPRFRSMDISRGLSIVATSEDSVEFARMPLTKDELVLDLETNEARKYVMGRPRMAAD